MSIASMTAFEDSAIPIKKIDDLRASKLVWAPNLNDAQ